MSVPVDLDALRARVAEYGAIAFLITTSERGTAHVVSVALGYDETGLRMATGRTSRANLRRNPELTLLWPPGTDPAYSMIVDATVVSFLDESEEIIVAPHSAVLHRMANATGEGPTCLPVDEPRSRD